MHSVFPMTTEGPSANVKTSALKLKNPYAEQMTGIILTSVFSRLQPAGRVGIWHWLITDLVEVRLACSVLLYIETSVSIERPDGVKVQFLSGTHASDMMITTSFLVFDCSK